MTRSTMTPRARNQASARRQNPAQVRPASSARTSPPLRRAPARDPHRCGHMRNRGAGLDPATQQQSSLRGQRGVTVAHEDLWEVVLAWTPAHLRPEVFALVDPYRVTNLYERNS
jgi:hypothetical protein